MDVEMIDAARGIRRPKGNQLPAPEHPRVTGGGTMTTRGLALGILLALVTTAGPTFAQSFGADQTDRSLQITWNPTTRRGQPAIEGYVVNKSGWSYRRIELAINGTDGSGRTLPTTFAYVNGEISPYDRGYFRTALPAAGDNYQVTIRSYERFGGGAGGM